MVKVKKDLSGRVFGKLLVLRQDKNDYVMKSEKKEAKWIVKCNCGHTEEFSVLGSSLKRGKTKSCGCERKRIISELKRKRNKFVKIKDGYTVKTLHGEFYIDEEDKVLIDGYYWHITNNGYVVCNSWIGGGKYKTILLHRFLLEINGYNINGITVDHKDRVKINNKKSNLRIATQSQQNMNTKIRKNNTSGYTGIRWDENLMMYDIRLTKDYKTYRDYSSELSEAIKIREEWKNEYFKEFKPNR